MSARHAFGSALVLALGLFTSLGGPRSVAAQSGADAGWLPWLGCWQAVATDPLEAPSTSAICLIPTDNPNQVERLTIEDGAILQREALDASGTARPVNREGCTGEESMIRAASGRRVFHRS